MFALTLHSPAGDAFYGEMKKCVILFALLSAVLAAGAGESLVKVSVLDNNVLCVRSSRLPGNVADEIRAASVPSHWVGLVLDLRFADGAATNAAEYFIRKQSPLVVLVNSQTRGPAVSLAAQLRAEAQAVLIGGTNFPAALSPDIAVAVGVEDEKKFQENPFLKPSSSAAADLASTNDLVAFVDHTSEADLVRKRIKDGDDDGEVAKPRAEPPQPVIRDPELARAVDLLKALAALHPARG
jgi:hypothetical protein